MVASRHGKPALQSGTSRRFARVSPLVPTSKLLLADVTARDRAINFVANLSVKGKLNLASGINISLLSCRTALLCFTGAFFITAVGCFVIRKCKDSSVAHCEDSSVAICDASSLRIAGKEGANSAKRRTRRRIFGTRPKNRIKQGRATIVAHTVSVAEAGGVRPRGDDRPMFQVGLSRSQR